MGILKAQNRFYYNYYVDGNYKQTDSPANFGNGQVENRTSETGGLYSVDV